MTNLAVPSLTAPQVGNPISQSYLTNQMYNPLTFLLNPPLFAGYQVTGQSIPTGQSAVAINMDGTLTDTYGGHSNSTNPSRYTAQVAGVYKVWGGFAGGGFTSQTVFLAYIAKNGAEVVGSRASDVGNASHSYALATIPVFVTLAVGDYVELWGASDVTGVAHVGNPTSSLNVEWRHI